MEPRSNPGWVCLHGDLPGAGAGGWSVHDATSALCSGFCRLLASWAGIHASVGGWLALGLQSQSGTSNVTWARSAADTILV